MSQENQSGNSEIVQSGFSMGKISLQLDMGEI